jgi:hypothetical protein
MLKIFMYSILYKKVHTHSDWLRTKAIIAGAVSRLSFGSCNSVDNHFFFIPWLGSVADGVLSGVRPLYTLKLSGKTKLMRLPAPQHCNDDNVFTLAGVRHDFADCVHGDVRPFGTFKHSGSIKMMRLHMRFRLRNTVDSTVITLAGVCHNVADGVHSDVCPLCSFKLSGATKITIPAQQHCW